MNEKLRKLLLPLLYASLFYGPTVMALWLLGYDLRLQGGILYLVCAMGGYGLALTRGRLKIGWHLALAPAAGFALAWALMPILYMKLAAGLLGAVLMLLTDRSCARPYYEAVTIRKFIVGTALMAGLQAVIYLERVFGGGRLYGLTPVMTSLAFFWFIMTVFVVNRLTVRNASYLEEGRNVPRSLSASNTLLVTLFLAAVMVVAYVRQLRDAAARAMLALRDQILRLLLWLMSRQSGGEMGNDTGGGNIMDMLKALQEDRQKSPFWERVGIILLYVVVGLAALALVGLLLWAIYKGVRKLWIYLRDRLSGFMNDWQANRAGYVEEEEDLFSWKQVSEDLRRGMNRIARRFRPRVRLEDLPDDASRVRMVFRWMLLKLRKQDLYDPARTPSEYGSQLPQGPDARRFIDAYNRARFSSRTVDAGDTQAAKATYGKL